MQGPVFETHYTSENAYTPFENTSKDSILSVMTVLISMNVSVINVEESAAWSV